MDESNLARLRNDMVARQIVARGVRCPLVLDAMRAVLPPIRPPVGADEERMEEYRRFVGDRLRIERGRADRPFS